MAITDNILYRLKPEAGDSAPHNEIGGGNVLSGGVISLVDRTGSGDWAWQFSGADSTATGISKTVTVGDAAGGFTMAITLKVVTGPSVDFTRYVQMYKNGDANTYFGLTQNGANQIRARYAASGNCTATIGTVGTTEFTYVLRLSTNGGSNEVLDVWKKTTGRVGTTPDFTGSAATLSTTLDRLLVGGQNSEVLQVKDWVIWSDEKSNAECAAGADDLRGQLDNAAVSGSLSWTEENDIAALTGTVAISGVGGSIAWTEANDTCSITGLVVTVGTLTTKPLKNNTGAVWANQMNVTLNIYNPSTGELILQATGLTTDANGIATVTDVDLVGVPEATYEPVLGDGRRRLPIAEIT